jgi:hypothetical protein
MNVKQYEELLTEVETKNTRQTLDTSICGNLSYPPFSVEGRNYISSTPRRAIVSAPRRSGRTTRIILSALLEASENPGRTIFLLTPDANVASYIGEKVSRLLIALGITGFAAHIRVIPMNRFDSASRGIADQRVYYDHTCNER